MRQGRGGSHRESSLLPIDHLGVIYDSQPHGYALFTAIQIRVNIACQQNDTNSDISEGIIFSGYVWYYFVCCDLLYPCRDAL
jgi:hypothetical protein